MTSQIKTMILLTILTVFFIVIGRILGGPTGMTIALILALGLNFFSYWFSDKIVLKMYRAQEVGPENAPELYNIVRELSNSADLPMPKLYMIPDDSPNAFATGRNPDHAAVAVTRGLMNIMDKNEVRGVLAHELAHVKNRDVLIGTIAATIAGAIMYLATMARWAAIFGMGGDDEEGGMGIIGILLMSILAPIAAVLIQMAISRSNEYRADAKGAKFADPNGLASALEKLGAYSRRVPMKKVNEATAHMFIVNPLTGGFLSNLFSTHPPVQERIARLRGQQFSREKSGKSDEKNMDDQARKFWDQLK